MKRYFALVAALMVAAMLAGCGDSAATGEATAPATSEIAATAATTSGAETSEAPSSEEPSSEAASFKLSDTLNIGVLKGPTGIGMAALFDMADDGFNMQLFDSPDQVTAKLISGELDIAAVPSNLGSVLYNTTEGGVKALSVVCGSTLYLVSTTGEEISSVKDLEGKTIYASGQGGVPEYVLSYVLASENVTADVQWLASHADAMSTMLTAEGGAIAMLPEPNVTVAKSKSENAKVIMDLGAQWLEKSGSKLPMGIMVVRSELLESRADDIRTFLEAGAYSTGQVVSGAEGIYDKIAELGIVPAAGIAKAVVPSCDIMFLTGAETVREPLENFYKILFDFNPNAIGKSLPGDDYYTDLK